LIVLFNVFGDAAIPLLIFKIESQYWGILKSYLEFLNRLEVGLLPQTEFDEYVQEELRGI
jgi:hypothetical protein